MYYKSYLIIINKNTACSSITISTLTIIILLQIDNLN